MEEPKTKNKNKLIILRAVWVILALLGLWTISRIASLQSEASASILFGLSLSRLVIAFGVLGLVLIFLGLALIEKFRAPILERIVSTFREYRFGLENFLIAGSIFLGWLGFGGRHNFEKLQDLFIRLLPVVQYLALILFLHFLYLAYIKLSGEDQGTTDFQNKYRFLRPAVIIFIVLLIVWGFVALTGIGITPGYPYWGEAGTYFFGYQFVMGGVLSIFVVIFFREVMAKKPKIFDLSVFILLWVVTGILWNSVELGHNFFAPRTFFQPYYPYSDAAVYDNWAYAILIGEGFVFPGFNSRALYVSFLTGLHLISGGDYNLLVAIQVFVFALIIPGLYLLGKELHSRGLGLLVALLGIFSQLNSMAANPFVRVSNTKLLLTEVPTGVVLVYVAYLFISGMKKGKAGHNRVLLSFGLIGLSLLLRMHVALVFIGLFGVLFITYPKLKLQFRNGVSLFVMILMIVFPWMLRNYFAKGAFSLDPGRFDILMENRWNPDNDSDQSEQYSSPPSKNQKSIQPELNNQGFDLQFPLEGFKEILAHFMHNEVLSVMSLPTTLHYQTAQNYYENSYFLYSDWEGELTGNAPFFVTTNLLLLSVGVWTAYKKLGVIGLVPLVIQISYNAANALVRTSGWRYLTPTEWVLILYLSLGLIQVYNLTRSLISREKIKNEDSTVAHELREPISIKAVLSVGAVFFLVTSFISFGPLLVPQKFPPSERNNVSANIITIAENSDFNINELEAFMENENAVLDLGKVLYPRFYFPNKGIFHYRSEIVDYSRLEFSLINGGIWSARIAVEQPEANLTHEENVLLLGCRTRENRIDAMVVIGLGNEESRSLIQRSDLNTLSCPVETPAGL